MIVRNVLKAKYPDLHEFVADAAASSLLKTPINWEENKTRPIWAINERLLMIPCARNVAKSVAADVVKESTQFILQDFQQERIVLEDTSPSLMPKEVDDKVASMGCDNSDDEGIDWDDI